MSTIKLTADDGETLTGRLPDSWAEVPLAPYAALASAELLPAKVRALASLVGLPPEPLLANIRHYGVIRQAAPWLFSGELPAATAPVPSFEHLGTTYAHVGALDTISAQQMAALYDFLAEAEGQPLTAAPGLLAVLYAPASQTQTAAVVERAQAAFATLPMSIAWPALADFLRAGASAAQLLGTYSALSTQAEAALHSLEQTLAASSASTRYWQRPLRFLSRQWIKSVRATLLTAWS